MLKRSLAWLVGVSAWFVLISCTPAFTGYGTRDAAGNAHGSWKIYKYGWLRATGQFVDGKLNGQWQIFDEQGVKIADLPFSNGLLHGKYILYYGSAKFPEAAGRLKTIGHAEHGQFTGDFERYLPTGKLQVRYKAKNRIVTQLLFGTWADAQDQVWSDDDLIGNTFVNSILAAARQS